MRQACVVSFRRYALYLDPYEKIDISAVGHARRYLWRSSSTLYDLCHPICFGRPSIPHLGFLKDIPERKDFEVVNYIRPDSALAKVALKPEDITDIILTHPHWDHIDGIGLFPKAHIWIQKDDYGYFVGAATK